jgi:hypothetical protein
MKFSLSKMYRNNISTLLITICALISLDCRQDRAPQVEIRGIYGNPAPFWDQGIKLNNLGVNAVFVHSGAINHDMISRVKNEGLKLFAEFATLNGKRYVEEHPEAWAVNHKGEKVEAATWFMGVCPTNPGFREYRANQLRELLQKFQLDGVWLDYVHWHAQFEDPHPILPETCFCDHCIAKFSSYTGITIPDGNTVEMAQWILENKDSSWRDWRCRVILEWVVEMKDIVKVANPEALLGLYHCPWKDDEYHGASRRILGLDYDLLKEVVEVFSPMVYHGRMERSPEWVADNIEWFSRRLEAGNENGPRIWTIVQAYDDPHVISEQEFETVLRGGLSGQSSGVMMFTSNAVAENQAKTEVMKKVYTSLAVE